MAKQINLPLAPEQVEEAAKYLCANFGRHTWAEANESVRNYYRAGIDGIVQRLLNTEVRNG